MGKDPFDLVIKGGTLATAADSFAADLGITDGRIAAIGTGLAGNRSIDATGRYVLPGGIETHAHIAQESSAGLMPATDYTTGSIAAAFGGNTMLIPFAAQQRGQSIADVLKTYDGRSEGASVLDYSYHLICSDPDEATLGEGLPMAFRRGITSFKVFLTYDRLRIDEAQMLDILTVARAHGALTMVHAENHGITQWMTRRLLDRGYVAPRYQPISRPRVAEEEAIHRAVLLARFAEAPLLVVHVSTDAGARIIAAARAEGAQIWGETCPQYLFLAADRIGEAPGLEGGKYCISPPLRGKEEQAQLWEHLRRGRLQIYATDHAPYRFDPSGKLVNGPDAPFDRIPPGMPGIERRCPLLFSEGVNAGRISINEFVALTSTNAARLFGLHPKKGTLAIGADADIAIWDPDLERRIEPGMTHDGMDYDPFENWLVRGWPVTVLNRGETVIEEGRLTAEPGRGRFVARAPVPIPPRRYDKAPELDPARNFGAELV